MTTGVVVSFDERNGFGFIRSRAFAQDVLVHAHAVAGGKLLRVGQRVRFEAEPSENGPRAVRVVLRRVPFRIIAKLTPEAAVSLGIAAGLLALACLGKFAAGWSWLISWLLAVNPVAFIAFAIDKRRAILGQRRISESLLLGLTLAGASPAVLLAMPLLRHKSHKGAFRLAVAAIVALQVVAVALVWWLSKR
jgi:uncharacterized membrane protein YsdA (DUF1294 family)/cold shock CspA family protein